MILIILSLCFITITVFIWHCPSKETSRRLLPQVIKGAAANGHLVRRHGGVPVANVAAVVVLVLVVLAVSGITTLECDEDGSGLTYVHDETAL
jgi:hypothetical protein